MTNLGRTTTQPVSRKSLRTKFPAREITVHKTTTSRGAPAVRISISGVPRGVARDPHLGMIYQEIEYLKTHCSYAGKPILY